MRWGMPPQDAFNSHWLVRDLRGKSEKEFRYGGPRWARWGLSQALHWVGYMQLLPAVCLVVGLCPCPLVKADSLGALLSRGFVVQARKSVCLPSVGRTSLCS